MYPIRFPNEGLNYDYGGGTGYMSRMSGGGEMPAYKPTPLPTVGDYSPRFQSDAAIVQNDMFRSANANNYAYDMKIGPMKAQADMAAVADTRAHNFSMEQLRAKLAAEKEMEEMRMRMQMMGNGNDMAKMRYATFLRTGE